MFVKLLGPFLGFIISIMNIIIQKSKGKSFSKLQWYLIIFLIMSSIIASIIIIEDANDEKIRFKQLKQIAKKSDESNLYLKKLNVSDSLTISLLKNQIVTSQTNEKQAQKEREELKVLLAPIEKLATEKYPDYKLDKALNSILQDLERIGNETVYLKQRNNYKPLSNKRKELLRISFINFNLSFKKKFEFEIMCSIDDINRKKFAEEFKDILIYLGFENVKLRWINNLVIGKYSSPIIIYCNRNDIPLITDFVTKLSQYMFSFKTVPIFQPSYKNDLSNSIKFDIKSNPYFNKDGVISFE